MKNHTMHALGVLVLSLTLTSTPFAWAGKGNADNPGILPPHSSAHGQSYGAWSDAWCAWALSIPAATNPMLDPTGEFGAVGQSGSVWFLAGSWGAETSVKRTLTVPPGKTLVFPVINYFWVNTPEYGDNPWSPEQEAYARTTIAAQIDTAHDLSCQIDGREVPNLQAYRCQTPVAAAHMISLPEGNVWGLPADSYGPMVTDGYYLIVTPLPPGKHTIRFTGGLGDSLPMEIIYSITVKR